MQQEDKNSENGKKVWGLSREISENINLIPLSADDDTPPYTPEERKRIWDMYFEILDGKGTFLGQVEEALFSLVHDNNSLNAYTLLPLNQALWIYKLGAESNEVVQLYEGLAQGYRKYARFRASKNRTYLIRSSDMPISSSMVKMCSKSESFRYNARKRDFARLQGLITAASCAIAGDYEDSSEAEKMYEILANAAPKLIAGLSPLQNDGQEIKLLTAVWAPENPWWNTSLYMVCKLNEAMLLLFAIINRWELRGKRSGQLEVHGIDRKEFFTFLCTQLHLTSSLNYFEALKKAAISGRKAFW